MATLYHSKLESVPFIFLSTDIYTSKKYSRVKPTFGDLHKWFGCHIISLNNLQKVHHQHILEATAYNLKRSGGLEHLMVKYEVKKLNISLQGCDMDKYLTKHYQEKDELSTY